MSMVSNIYWSTAPLHYLCILNQHNLFYFQGSSLQWNELSVIFRNVHKQRKTIFDSFYITIEHACIRKYPQQIIKFVDMILSG